MPAAVGLFDRVYAEEFIGADVVDAELQEATVEGSRERSGDTDSLGETVERHLSQYFAAHEDGLPPSGLYGRVIREIERPLIAMCLSATRGNQIRAAQLLGLNRNTLRKKINDLQIPVVRGVQ